MVDIDQMQYGFMPGWGTVDAVFVLRRLSETFRVKNKLFFTFADLENAFMDENEISFLQISP